MICTIKNQLRLAIPNIIGCFVFVLLGGLLGTVIFEAIMRIVAVHEESPTTFEMAFLMGITMFAIFKFFSAFSGAEQSFNYTVGMGRTRKSFFIGYTLSALLSSFAGIAALLIIRLTEQPRLTIWWKGYPCDSNFTAVFTPAFLCWIAVMASIIQELVGMLIIRFGKKVAWVFWFLWMLGCIGIPRITDAMKAGKNSAFAKFGYWCQDFYGSIPYTVWILILTGVGLIAFLITFLGFRRQKVTF